MRISSALLVLPISLIICFSCKKDDPVVEKDGDSDCEYADSFTEELEGTISDYGIVPVNLTNYWVYADTTWINDSTYSLTSIDTVRAYLPRKTNDDFEDLWFLIDGSWPATTIHQSSEQMYTLETDYNGCKYKAKAFYEADADTVISTRWINDYGLIRKEYKNTGIISTLAGDFSDCSVFEYENSAEYQILKPGIGFVKFAFESYEESYREFTLMDYYIE